MEDQDTPNIQPEQQPVQESRQPNKFLIVAIGAFVLLVIMVGMFFVLQNDGVREKVLNNEPAQDILNDIPDGFGNYRNDSLGIKFFYPQDYVKLRDESYPIPLVTFVNSSSCTDDLSWASGEKFGDCFVLNVWQQPEPYNYNLSATNFYRNESLRLDGTNGTIKTYERFGTEITTIQFPRYAAEYDSKVAGELIIQYSYRRENSARANEILKVLLESLEVNPIYAKVSPPDCCGQEAPIVLIRNAGKLFLLESGELKEVPIALEDSVGGEEISPDGNEVAFLHWNYERDRGGLFRSAKTGVAVVGTTPPYKITKLIEPGKNAHTYLSWSPNGRYLSYVLDDGQGVGMLDTLTQKEVFSFVAENYSYDAESGGRPVVWLNENEFSFIYDGKLYLGNPNNPTNRVIASNVTNAQSRFESAPRLYEPLWSPDDRYVMYRTKDSAVLQDTTTGKKYSFGKQVDSEFGSYLSISEVGWTKNNEFLFEEDNMLKLAKMTLDGLAIQEIPELAGDNLSYDLIADGSYVVSYSGYLTFPLEIFDLGKKVPVCPDLKAGKYYSSAIFKQTNSAYLVANPLVPNWVQWPNNSDEATDQAERILEIFDIAQCESLGGVIIDHGDGVRLNVQMISN